MRIPETASARVTTVGDVMKPHVVTVVPEMTLAELVQTFLEKQVRGAPVLSPAGKVIGVVSETDVLRYLLCTGHLLDHASVRDVMCSTGAVLSPGDDIAHAAHAFACDRVQRVVVMENDMLLGIVTPADLMPALELVA